MGKDHTSAGVADLEGWARHRHPRLTPDSPDETLRQENFWPGCSRRLGQWGPGRPEQ